MMTTLRLNPPACLGAHLLASAAYPTRRADGSGKRCCCRSVSRVESPWVARAIDSLWLAHRRWQKMALSISRGCASGVCLHACLPESAFALHCSSIMSLGYMTMVCHKFFLLGQALRAGSESGSRVLAAARSAGVLRRPARRQDEASASWERWAGETARKQRKNRFSVSFPP